MMPTHRRYGLLALCAALSACSDPSGLPDPAAIEISGNVVATAPVSSAVAVSVRVTDDMDRPMAGVPVTFVVTAGGGSVSTATVTTNSAGVATQPAWTLGSEPGVNTLEARVEGLPPLQISITAADVLFEKFAGDNSSCPIGTAGCRFSVRVRTLDGSTAAGHTVTWTGPGGATLTTVTNADGIAVAPNLGTNSTVSSRTQTAFLVSQDAELTFTFNLIQGGQYDLEIRYVGTISDAHRAAFESARVRWEEVITGDLPSLQLDIAAGACKDKDGNALVEHPAINEQIDDLLVYVQIDSIDGPGKVLGSAGPCFIRSTSRLPVFGIMRFDRADLNLMNQNGLLGDVILHELGHVIGFPSIWKEEQHQLLQGGGTTDPYFTGRSGVSLFTLAGGRLVVGEGVPVENSGGTGTVDSHWRESILSNELMTGFISSGANPLSAITIGSLQDIGYQVNFAAADPYTVPMAGGMSTWSSLQLEMIELPMPAPREVGR